MNTPNDYSDDPDVRSFEKSALERAYEAACDPRDHVDECAPTNRNCPYRDT